MRPLQMGEGSVREGTDGWRRTDLVPSVPLHVPPSPCRVPGMAAGPTGSADTEALPERSSLPWVGVKRAPG